jgi:protein gp37
MGAKSNIEWTDASWTPIRARNLKTGKTGWHCEHDTTGCIHCYSEAMNLRLGTGLPFKPGHRKDIEIFLDKKMLQAPLHWRKPRMVFVCSMTDLFADFMKDEWIDCVFDTMETAHWHTYQVLTKRSRRQRNYVNRRYVEKSAPKNIWFGVSVEDQPRAEARIPNILQTRAAIRFISAEPLLGPIGLTRLCILPQKPDSIRSGIHIDVLRGKYCESGVAYTGDWDIRGPAPPDSERRKLDWVIVGGESGKEARPMQLEWATDIVQQCEPTDVKCFVKQLGDAAQSDGYVYELKKPKGGDPSEWPDVLQVRQMPLTSMAVKPEQNNQEPR